MDQPKKKQKQTHSGVQINSVFTGITFVCSSGWPSWSLALDSLDCRIIYSYVQEADDQTGPDNNGDELFENDNEDEESTSTNATVQHMITDSETRVFMSGDAEHMIDTNGSFNNENKDVESTFQVQPGNYVSLQHMSPNGKIAHIYDIDNHAIAEVEKWIAVLRSLSLE